MTRCRRTVFGMVHSFSFRGRCDRSVASGSSSGSSRLPRRSMSKTPHRTTFRHDAKFFLQDTFRPILWAHHRGPDDTPAAGAGHALPFTPPAQAVWTDRTSVVSGKTV